MDKQPVSGNLVSLCLLLGGGPWGRRWIFLTCERLVVVTRLPQGPHQPGKWKKSIFNWKKKLLLVISEFLGPLRVHHFVLKSSSKCFRGWNPPLCCRGVFSSPSSPFVQHSNLSSHNRAPTAAAAHQPVADAPNHQSIENLVPALSVSIIEQAKRENVIALLTPLMRLNAEAIWILTKHLNRHHQKWPLPLQSFLHQER